MFLGSLSKNWPSRQECLVLMSNLTFWQNREYARWASEACMRSEAAIDLHIFRSAVAVIACQSTDFANLDALLVLLDVSSQREIALCNSLIFETKPCSFFTLLCKEMYSATAVVASRCDCSSQLPIVFCKRTNRKWYLVSLYKLFSATVFFSQGEEWNPYLSHSFPTEA